MDIQCSIILLSQESGYTQTTRSRCVSQCPCQWCPLCRSFFLSKWISRRVIIAMAIGYPTNCLRHRYFHNIRRIAASECSAFLHGLAFVVACQLTSAQSTLEMWYPTPQAMIRKLYVLSHFYNMYVVPATVHIMFTILLSVSQQCSSAVCCRWRAGATIDTHAYAHCARAPRGKQLHTQRPRSRFLRTYRRCAAISIGVGSCRYTLVYI